MDKLYNEVSSIKQTQMPINDNLTCINTRLDTIEADQELLRTRVSDAESKKLACLMVI